MPLPCPTIKDQKSQYFCQCKTGFSLIELVVTVSLLGILTAIGISSYNNYNDSRVVKNAAETIKLNLRLAQTKAMAGEKDCSVCDGGNCDVSLVGWYASFSSLSPPQMQIYGQCGSTNFGTKTIEINSALTLSLTNIPSNKILFKPIRGEADLISQGEILVTGFGKSNTVYVTTGGEIR